MLWLCLASGYSSLTYSCSWACEVERSATNSDVFLRRAKIDGCSTYKNNSCSQGYARVPTRIEMNVVSTTSISFRPAILSWIHMHIVSVWRPGSKQGPCKRRRITRPTQGEAKTQNPFTPQRRVESLRPRPIMSVLSFGGTRRRPTCTYHLPGLLTH